MDFNSNDIVRLLSSDNQEVFDDTNFGIIGMDANNIITLYNRAEAEFSGYSKEAVLGKNLFIDVAPCMNNYLVALKFDAPDDFDEIVPYILSFKVKPTPVDLRLIKKGNNRFVLIKRK